METETDITKLQITEQDYIRCLVARNNEPLYKQHKKNKNHNTQKIYQQQF